MPCTSCLQLGSAFVLVFGVIRASHGKDGVSEKPSQQGETPWVLRIRQLRVILITLAGDRWGEFPPRGYVSALGIQTVRVHFGGDGNVSHLNDGGGYMAS